MYVKLDRTIIGRLTRIADALFETRLPAGTNYPAIQFPRPTLSTMLNLTSFLEDYWTSYRQQEAPDGVGLGRLRDGAVETLSAAVAIVSFLIKKEEKHGVIPFSCWLQKEKEPVQGDRRLSPDEVRFVKQIHYLLNVMRDLSSLALAQAIDLTECPDDNEMELRRQLSQVAERAAEQAFELLSMTGLKKNPALDQWRKKLDRAKQVQGLLLLLNAQLHDDVRARLHALLKGAEA